MNAHAMMADVARVAPETYDFLVKTASAVTGSPFREEIVSEFDGLLKKAAHNNPTGWGTVGHALAGIGGMAATGIAMSLAGDLFDAAKRGITKTVNYKSMMKENPDLADMNAKDVQKAFSTLHRFNPEFASDPTVAGSFVRRQAQLGEFDPKQLTELIGARKNLADIRKLPVTINKMPWMSAAERKQQGLDLKDSELGLKGRKLDAESSRSSMLKNDVEAFRSLKDLANVPARIKANNPEEVLAYMRGLRK